MKSKKSRQIRPSQDFHEPWMRTERLKVIAPGDKSDVSIAIFNGGFQRAGKLGVTHNPGVLLQQGPAMAAGDLVDPPEHIRHTVRRDEPASVDADAVTARTEVAASVRPGDRRWSGAGCYTRTPD